ncbi:MAG: prepilin-type N-terminal cleavage/methylation domain-containing protein [Kiritimatiellales bacterium]|jgi:prepilin-type N-terminal cleavage/methylation domain-containing protein
MKKKYNRKGVTLIELMITMAAASILLLIAALILIMAFQSWRINNAYAGLRRDAALAVYRISRDVRESNITNVTVAAGELRLSAHPPARNNAVTYTRTAAGALTSTDSGTIIPRGVQTFSAETNNLGDGVYLTVGMAANISGSAISITNRVFVNTRN